MSRRGGFTLLEMAVAVVLVVFLGTLALPRLHRALVRARATEAVSDLHVVRVAVLGYLADHHEYPSDVMRGEMPPGLAPYLPEGFAWTTEHFVLDYDNWTDQEGFVGLAVITPDTEVGTVMADLLGNESWVGRGRFTWILDWKR